MKVLKSNWFGIVLALITVGAFTAAIAVDVLPRQNSTTQNSDDSFVDFEGYAYQIESWSTTVYDDAWTDIWINVYVDINGTWHRIGMEHVMIQHNKYKEFNPRDASVVFELQQAAGVEYVTWLRAQEM